MPVRKKYLYVIYIQIRTIEAEIKYKRYKNKLIDVINVTKKDHCNNLMRKNTKIIHY